MASLKNEVSICFLRHENRTEAFAAELVYMNRNVQKKVMRIPPLSEKGMERVIRTSETGFESMR